VERPGLRRRSALVGGRHLGARPQSEYFLDAHEALFRARHDRAIRLVTLDEISNVLAPLGVDMAKVAADVASRRPTT